MTVPEGPNRPVGDENIHFGTGGDIFKIPSHARQRHLMAGRQLVCVRVGIFEPKTTKMVVGRCIDILQIAKGFNVPDWEWSVIPQLKHCAHRVL